MYNRIITMTVCMNKNEDKEGNEENEVNELT